MELFGDPARLDVATYLTEKYGVVGASVYFDLTSRASNEEERRIVIIETIRRFSKQSTEYRLKLSELRNEK